MNSRISALLIASVAFATFSYQAHAENFEGPFVGAAAGYSRDGIGPDLGDGITLANDLDQDAAYFQIFAGYDYVVAPKVRIGIEAAIGVRAEDELRLGDASGLIELDREYTFEATGRAGYLVSENALLYVRGGYQNSRVEATLAEAGQPTLRDKDNADGWLAGGGLEYASVTICAPGSNTDTRTSAATEPIRIATRYWRASSGNSKIQVGSARWLAPPA